MEKCLQSLLWLSGICLRIERIRKLQNAANKASKDLLTLKIGAFIAAPCPHDGPCPLQNTDKYCHFVQRLERTSSQRSYKVFVKTALLLHMDTQSTTQRDVLRPREPWPLDGMKFDTLKEMHAKRIPEDLEKDVESQFFSLKGQNDLYEAAGSSDSNAFEIDSSVENDNVEEEYDEDENGETSRADLRSG